MVYEIFVKTLYAETVLIRYGGKEMTFVGICDTISIAYGEMFIEERK